MRSMRRMMPLLLAVLSWTTLVHAAEVIPEPFRGTWIEAQPNGKPRSTLHVEAQSITWTRDEVGEPETTVSTDYTVIDATRISFPVSIVGARGAFTPVAVAQAQATVTITLNEQGLVLSIPEVKIPAGAGVYIHDPEIRVHTRDAQRGDAGSAAPSRSPESAKVNGCTITDARVSSYESSAIGYGGQEVQVAVLALTLANSSDQPIKLNWKNAIPVLQTTEKRVEAVRILIPNWLPAAGGVGPYSTKTSFSGEVISGFLEIDKDTWCGWLAIDKTGAHVGDHVSIPVKSATVTVVKDKLASFKLLFPEDIVLPDSELILPGCKPSPLRLGANPQKADVAPPNVPATASQRALAAQGLPENAELERLIADACLADRPSLQGYTALVTIKNIAADTPEKGKHTLNADVTFVYAGTALTLGYIDHFVLSRDETSGWKVGVVKKN